MLNAHPDSAWAKEQEKHAGRKGLADSRSSVGKGNGKENGVTSGIAGRGALGGRLALVQLGQENGVTSGIAGRGALGGRLALVQLGQTGGGPRSLWMWMDSSPSFRGTHSRRPGIRCCRSRLRPSERAGTCGTEPRHGCRPCAPCVRTSSPTGS